ncbi:MULTISPECIES: hypothetical protein [unclassified Methylocaldum]|jgi:hypothetical protein|uniref:hypothetical protein n=1 Tax=unclassified Methylocaldum TaxID=2622260 RepID=UPI00098B8CC7|nr:MULTISPECIES: hypothetical protein [unclassified Methylocaldum]MBP1151247.1 hypothetical protein [Methylocaldum sp. RMAD-M]
MAKAMLVIPANLPMVALQQIFSAFPDLAPHLVVDGVGAVVDVPNNLVASIASSPSVAALSTGPIANPQTLPIAPEAITWLEAWNRLFDPVYLDKLASRALKWLNTSITCQTVSAFGSPQPMMTLTGDIAVGILIVDGLAGSTAQITSSEFLDITLALIQGFEILYRNAPSSAKLVFVAEQRRIALSLNPATVPGPVPDPSTATFADYEARESLWRDPALQAIGFQAGLPGIDAYRANLMNRQWPAGAPRQSIVVLLSKYSAAHFAYAASGRLLLQFDRASLIVQPENLDRVIAHEICHLFNAPDEYGSCNPLQTFGPFGAVNGNCLNNPFAAIGHTPCLMAGEADDMCRFTKAHVGWVPLN